MSDFSALWGHVRAVAYSCVDFTELPPNSNRGQFVERVIGHVGLDSKGGYPWCAALVYWCGYWGLYDGISKKSVWPLKKTAGCADLGDFAKSKSILMDTPEVGDVFLIWYDSMKRFAHTGFVVAQNRDGTFLTIEGNTAKEGDSNPATMREGWGCFSRHRKFKPQDKFIRWTALLK